MFWWFKSGGSRLKFQLSSIQVENAFDGVVKYKNKKDEKDNRLSTRKEGKNGGEHGHGLKNIRRAVEKYNGHMDITHEGTVFSVAIVLFTEIEEKE